MRWIAAFLFTANLLASPVHALESAPVRSARMTATLITDSDTAEAGKPLRLGLRLRLAAGWHTYWQNPGDAGLPAELSLTLSGGAVAGGIAWPVPIRMREGPLTTYGYSGDVVLPVSVTPGTGGLDVQAAATWLVCEKICVPEQGTFHLAIPGGIAVPAPESSLFEAGDARQPRPSPFEAHVSGDTLTLSGAGLSSRTVGDAWFFPLEAVEAGGADVATVVRDGAVVVAIPQASKLNAAARLDGIMVLRDPGGQESYLSVSAIPGSAAPGQAADAAAVPATLLLLAFAGGLALNLMPCVFPILAMKALALGGMSGQSRGRVRLQAAAYTAGVLTAFAGLGALLMVLRSIGVQAGWGFQLQSPVVVVLLSWVLFAVALNLSGVFQVGTGVVGLGQGFAYVGGFGGSFVTGLLAVVVAAPCTAPFMGTAIAGALTGPRWLGMGIFLTLGLGLAAPYGLLAVVPGWVRLLPRPGRWMETFRGLLAFPLYAAASWMVWVVSLQAGPDGVFAAVAGLVSLGFAAWVFGRSQQGGSRIGLACAGMVAIATLALLPGVRAAAPGNNAADAGTEAFSTARLDALRANGRPVFVNITAAWCISCLVNERLALSPPTVRRAFKEHGIAYLKGDWTQGDPVITAFLHSQARDGVPLYLLYPAGTATPTVLPQILTEGDVLAQVAKLGV